MSYKSQIEMFTEQEAKYLFEETDDLVMKAVMNVSVKVDKDELVKALAYDRDQYEKGFNDGMMENKWIPTSKQLPELDQKVLASCRYSDGEEDVDICVYANIFGRATFWADEGWKAPETVLAWMPLPEQYKEE